MKTFSFATKVCVVAIVLVMLIWIIKIIKAKRGDFFVVIIINLCNQKSLIYLKNHYRNF
jgi:hypothetical protein